MSKKEIFSKKTKEEIVKSYFSGIPIRKLEKLFHKHSSKIKAVLDEYNIDIHDKTQPGGSQKALPKGYWDIKENTEALAKTCRNRTELAQKSSTAWKAANKHGWLKEFQEKYFTSEPSFQPLYSRVHYVYAYEVSETRSVYVGRTNDLKRRDRAHRNQTLKDVLREHCEIHNIPIPTPIVLEDNLTAEESQEKENSWIEKYRNNGWSILNKAKTGAGVGSLGSTPRKWNYETCKCAAETCKNKEEFKKRFSRAHNVSRYNGWINEFFPFNSKREDGCFETLEGCKAACVGFKTITQIRREYPFLYHKISKNKWTEEIRNFIKETPESKYNDIKERMGNSPLFFNQEEYLPISHMNKDEVSFLETIKNYSDLPINVDKASVFGSRLIVRIDAKMIVFVLINVKKNSSFKNNVRNFEFKDIRKYSETHGYRCIQIYDSEFNDKRGIIEGKICHFLGSGYSMTKKIGGRQIFVKEILSDEAKHFLEENHIQGSAKASVYLGGFYNNELVAVMCFKNGGINRISWDLTRFATSPYYIYSGVGGKMFSYFIKNYKPDSVISFADQRWGILPTNMYTKIGFKKDRDTDPSYMYFNSNEKAPHLFHKLVFTKKRLLDRYGEKYGFTQNMTETEMAKALGYDRIWDCGLIKYVWKKENPGD